MAIKNSLRARNRLQGIDSMIQVLVLANDSILADIIVSTLSKEIDMDVVRMTRQQLSKGDRYSVVILVDEEEPESEPFRFLDLFRDGITLLLIRVSFQSRDIFIYECYQINNPSVERVAHLVRDFGRAHLKKKDKENGYIGPLRRTPCLSQLQSYPDSLAGDG